MRNHIRNLMIEAVNEAISANGITLDTAPIQAGYIFPTIFDRPAFVSWRDIGFDEVRVTLWWDYDGSNDAPNETYSATMPCVPRQHLPGLVGLTASVWFERRNGFHIQGTGSRGLFDTFVRKGIKHLIAGLPDAEPLGFKATGLVY